VKTRSDCGQLSVHAAVPSAQSQLPIELDALIQNHPRLVNAGVESESATRTRPQISDRAPKVTYLIDRSGVYSSKLKDSAEDPARSAIIKIIFQSRTRNIELTNCLLNVTPIGLVVIITIIIITTIIDLRRGDYRERQNQESCREY